MALESSNIFSTPDDDEEMPTSAETTSTGGPMDLWGTPEVKDTYRGKLHTVDPFFCSDVPMMGSKRESTPLDQGEGCNLVSSDADEEGASSDEGDRDQANTEQDLPGKEKAQDASRVKNKKKGAKKSGNTRRRRP